MSAGPQQHDNQPTNGCLHFSCSACNGNGYFRIGTGEAACRKCIPRSEEERRPFPSMAPSLFFTEEEVASVNWEAVFNEW